MRWGGAESVEGVSETGMRWHGAVLMEIFGNVATQREWLCLQRWGTPSFPLPGAAKIRVWISYSWLFWGYSRIGFVASFPGWISKPPGQCWGFVPLFNTSVDFTVGKFLLTPDLCFFPLLFQFILPPPTPIRVCLVKSC